MRSLCSSGLFCFPKLISKYFPSPRLPYHPYKPHCYCRHSLARQRILRSERRIRICGYIFFIFFPVRDARHITDNLPIARNMRTFPIPTTPNYPILFNTMDTSPFEQAVLHSSQRSSARFVVVCNLLVYLQHLTVCLRHRVHHLLHSQSTIKTIPTYARLENAL